MVHLLYGCHLPAINSHSAATRIGLLHCAGSAWRGAALAASPRFPGRGNSIDTSERTITSLTKVWPLWLLFGAVALVFVWEGTGGLIAIP